MSTTPSPSSPPSRAQVSAFITRLINLTTLELLTEEFETSLLTASTSNYPLLESKGLSLTNLAAASTSIGLGGKTLLTLVRSAAYSTEAAFPSHAFRSGDAVKILDAALTGVKGKKGKGKDEEDAGGKEREGLDGVVWKVGEQKIVVAAGRGRSAAGGTGEKGGDPGGKGDDLEIPARIRLLKLSNPTTYTRQISVLRQLHSSICPPSSPTLLTPPSPLISVLLGLTSPTLPPSSPNTPPLTFFNPTLNPSQQSAVSFVLRESGEVALIWGPPGTGKTFTLIEIVQHYLAEGKRILICGSSNLSVDNLLLRLSLLPGSIPLTRIGHPARVMSGLESHTLDSQSLHSNASEILVGVKEDLEKLQNQLLAPPVKGAEGNAGNGKGVKRLRGKEKWEGWNEVRELRKEFKKREGRVVKEVVDGARVVLATCHGAGNRTLAKEEFDIVIIDEAAQCVEPWCWIPIMKAKKLILAGDHLQLPPTIKSDSFRDKKKLREAMAAESATKEKKKKEVSVEAVSKDVADVKLDSKEGDDESESSDEEISIPLPSEMDIDLESAQDPDNTLDLAPVDLSPVSPDKNTASSAASTNSPASLRLVPSSSLSVTLFSRLLKLHGPSIRRMLTTQYRFNSTLMEFPSKFVYEGKLEAHESVASRRLVLKSGEGDEEVEEEASEVIFIDTVGAAMYERVESEAGGKGKGGSTMDSESKSNENEAVLVQNYVRYLIKHKVPATSIAIISPYNAQVSLLSTLLQPLNIEIGSIDSFQGREKEVVIISLVRSNAKGEIGFLAELRRLNVAMTRARSQLVVVGDSGTIKKGGNKYLRSWMDWLEEKAEVRLAEEVMDEF